MQVGCNIVPAVIDVFVLLMNINFDVMLTEAAVLSVADKAYCSLAVASCNTFLMNLCFLNWLPSNTCVFSKS